MNALKHLDYRSSHNYVFKSLGSDNGKLPPKNDKTRPGKPPGESEQSELSPKRVSVFPGTQGIKIPQGICLRDLVNPAFLSYFNFDF